MNQTRQERAKSYFYNMRRFHNHIKRELYNKYTNGITNLLDLACGKLGDLDKWISNNITNVVGYDINPDSIEEAKRRIDERDFNAMVYVKDLSRNVLDGNKKFDAVTSMFAFHYFFESNETFETIMKSIDNNLKYDGYFIGTMFDGEQIRKVLNKADYILNDNDNDNNTETRFKITKHHQFTNDLFGNKISVFLKDTVLDEPMDEYLVYFNKFVEVMKIKGYNLVESKMFNELYQNSFKLNDLSKKVSFLNRTFVFKRSAIKEKKEELKCNKETEYLIECDWYISIQEKILDKYKKSLTNKMNTTENKQAKNDYMFIRDNFKDIENVLKNDTISNSVKKYFSTVYQMYLLDINKYN